MGEFFGEALFINHVNFSGMNLEFQPIMKLLKSLKRCHFLIGIHLSNNGITSSKNFSEMMRYYGITEEDLIACNRSKVADAKGELPNPAHLIDYDGLMRPYLTLS